MQYRYAGPHPVTDEDGQAVHPGDVREFEEAPGWGPWEPPEEPPPPPRPVVDVPLPAEPEVM